MIERLVSDAKIVITISSLLLSTPAFADHVVTDQIGRRVHIPDAVALPSCSTRRSTSRSSSMR